MKKLFLIIIFLHITLFAYTYEDLVKDYENKNYKNICEKRAVFYKNAVKDENILSIIGDSCARVDYINPLGYVIRGLISTPHFRENGSYFATLVLQKKLIYQFMNDGINLKNLRLPRSKHTLSIVFENLVKNNYIKENRKIIIKTSEKEYRVWVNNAKKRVVIVEEYENSKKIKTHWYL